MKRRIANMRQTEKESFNQALSTWPYWSYLDNSQKNGLFSSFKLYHELRLKNEKKQILSETYDQKTIDKFRKDYIKGTSWVDMEKKYKLSRVGMTRYLKDLPKRHQDKLEEKIIIEIYKKFKAGGYTQADSTREYSISKKTAYRIYHKKTDEYKRILKNL